MESRSLEHLRHAASTCNICAHACDATQTVFGYGCESASIMIVGEQPGDQEDVRGRPFVGPSGELIRRLLAELSVDDDELYFTNAVKHFKYTVRGKRRIHKSPTAGEIEHCRGWLFEELAVVRPSLVIALGASAARALLGRPVKLQEHRGKVQPFAEASQLMLTTHPAFVLRAGNQRDRHDRELRLREDIKLALNSIGLSCEQQAATSA